MVSAERFRDSADFTADDPLPDESYGCLISCSRCLTVSLILHIIVYSTAALQMILTPTCCPGHVFSERTDWCGIAAFSVEMIKFFRFWHGELWKIV